MSRRLSAQARVVSPASIQHTRVLPPDIGVERCVITPAAARRLSVSVPVSYALRAQLDGSTTTTITTTTCLSTLTHGNCSQNNWQMHQP